MSCRKSLTAVVEHREPMDGDTFVATTDLLANLIDDILLSILEYLPKASLTGTGRVSRRFRALTLPILYLYRSEHSLHQDS
jgi:hypothetical protein